MNSSVRRETNKVKETRIKQKRNEIDLEETRR